MKSETLDPMTSAPQEEQSILDEIRNDHELIERLQITPQELQALSRCSLLGTLSCKEDMLFILRQIRESGTLTGLMLPAPDSSEGPELDFSECPSLSEYEARESAPPALPDVPSPRPRVRPVIITEPASDEGARWPLAGRLAVLSVVVVMAAGPLWEGFVAVSRWGGAFMTAVGTRFSQVPSSGWYRQVDRFGSLLLLEALFLGAVMAVICLRSLRGFRRLRVMPGWRY
jgi:hypothetical protein